MARAAPGGDDAGASRRYQAQAGLGEQDEADDAAARSEAGKAGE